jgi:hypothetical protein
MPDELTLYPGSTYAWCEVHKCTCEPVTFVSEEKGIQLACPDCLIPSVAKPVTSTPLDVQECMRCMSAAVTKCGICGDPLCLEHLTLEGTCEFCGLGHEGKGWQNYGGGPFN